MREHLNKGAHTPKLIKTKKKQKKSKDVNRRVPRKRDMFNILELSRQDNQELKLFNISNYLINVVRPVITLCFFMSLL